MSLILLSGLFLALCIFAALHDVNRLTIPNWLNLTIAALFVPAALVSGLPLEILGGHLLAGGLAFVIAVGLFAFRIFGGGDAKMIPAVVLWMGPGAALPFAYWMALVGGACALLLLVGKRSVAAASVPGFMRAPFEPKAGVPYGVAIAGGAILAGGASPLLARFYEAIGFPG
ncbi:MAG: prepilin peptidase [Hyphomonas sp.]|nr:prepilin peptidase [Hyphomonas sp.]MDP3460356.1 prepilin peptidase [Hyphomonas sp.]